MMSIEGGNRLQLLAQENWYQRIGHRLRLMKRKSVSVLKKHIGRSLLSINVVFPTKDQASFCLQINQCDVSLLLQDYPSIGQLARVLTANNIQLIFAVTKNISAAYEVLPESEHSESVASLYHSLFLS